MSEHLPFVASMHDPFGSTQWSVVLAAGGNGTTARAALAMLCEVYWLPVYGFVRSRTNNADDAYDVTQGFFADLLERNAVAAADPARGRFRAFLLTSVMNFLANQHARETAQKRGSGRPIASLDRDVAESRLTVSSARTPEQEFERRWALALLERVIDRLSAEQTAAGRAAEFAALRPFLTGQAESSQAEVADKLGITAEAVRAAVHRLRKRYRTLLRDEVAQTVGSAAEVDEELQKLLAAVSL